jgi:predicted nucleic acid-binding protein
MNGPLVVSDTSPLNYLILIEAIDLLPKLVSGVLIPPDVASELMDDRAPAAVRKWFTNPPSWLQIVAPLNIDASLGLDRGEAAAISLAVERGIRALLIDERKGFSIAKARGLEPVGTLALIEVSANRGLIDFDQTITRLRATSFRCSERLITAARQRLQSS